MTYVGLSDGYIVGVMSYWNTYYTWSLGGGGDTHDIQTVALHEAGHWLDLDDIPWYRPWDSNKVMWYAYTGVKTTLHQDDINGITDIYA